MTINKMFEETFERQTLEAWKQKAEETLKGKSIDSLSKNTYENIQLKPLYSQEDFKVQEVSQYPGHSDYRRGANSLGYLTGEWKIAQKLEAEDDESLKRTLLSSFEKGQTAISLDTDKMNMNDFEKVVEDIYAKYPFSIETNLHQALILSKLSQLPNSKKISGYIGMDPLAAAAVSGSVQSFDEGYDEWVKVIKSADSNMPELRTILIDTCVYHKGGANAVQELAIALSTGVCHLQQLIERSVSLEKILTKMVFKFSIGANFFMEIAKLRAARFLWDKVTEAYGAKAEDRKMVISAETSSFTKTSYDPYVNLLRAGNEAFAAVLGGIQFLHVSPFNEPEGKSAPFSDRIARNTQLILKEEAHMQKVADPAGGSWYVEHLTNELAEKAWAFFLQIEEKGGMAEVLKSGWIQDQIADVLKKRSKDIFQRKQSIIGTNIFANINEQPLQSEGENINSIIKVESKRIPQLRLSEPFERLRRAAEKIRQSGREPRAGLICLGELKEHKARADFMTGFLAPGGIQAVKSQDISNPEMVLDFIEKTNLKHYFICGTNKQYDELAVAIIRLIKEKQPNVTVFLAGLPEESNQQTLKQAGIKDFIHIRSNCYEILTSLLNEMGVASDDQEA
ncbi:methylmalonyl-CoA mutase subunit beta [Bacillus sp. FJAT-29790]|uniref:methylmalonyl-CoA mutase family protein n=1 Tax=Bacillus sp. FJAT-29790 TaxID=1895002 RepID=UPI001C227A76|nr:methylmalonyl-CoA mutase family protein [Bacillus sp. FJAT-29790]MBU8879309.1 methylmalonyl-CoA mutase subunit beta [Bacillus sp. FJAT-29790]